MTSYIVFILYNFVVVEVQARCECPQKRRVCDHSMGPGHPFARDSYHQFTVPIFRGHYTQDSSGALSLSSIKHD